MLEHFTWFKQAGYRWNSNGRRIYIDPWDVVGDEPADLILITHAHFDHFSPADIERIRRHDTQIVAPHDVARELSGGNVTAVRPGDAVTLAGVAVQAVPAYNVIEQRRDSHPKENNWVGYVFDLGGVRYYHAGDTDHLTELDSVHTEVAFLPIGGGDVTMTASEAATLAKAIGPDVAVPMHYGFVVGTPEDAETFRAQADPVRVEIMEPRHAFEVT